MINFKNFIKQEFYNKKFINYIVCEIFNEKILNFKFFNSKILKNLKFSQKEKYEIENFIKDNKKKIIEKIYKSEFIKKSYQKYQNYQDYYQNFYYHDNFDKKEFEKGLNINRNIVKNDIYLELFHEINLLLFNENNLFQKKQILHNPEKIKNIKNPSFEIQRLALSKDIKLLITHQNKFHLKIRKEFKHLILPTKMKILDDN